MMKKLTLLLLLGVWVASAAWAQSGALTADQLQKIRQSYQEDSYTKAMENALSNNDINKLALNRDNVDKVDQHFKYKVDDISGITDQKGSGRCWMFTSLNIFRPVAMRHFNVDEFEFSENYLYFYDIFEKANLFLNKVVASADLPFTSRKVNWYFKSPVDDGGVWNSFVNLVNKYGMVPKSVMPETHSSENTRKMVKFIVTKLREDGLELRQMVADKKSKTDIENRRVEMLEGVYRMLALNLGNPPEQFRWRYKDKDGNLSEYKTYTPQQFRDEVLGDIKLSDYVMLMNDPTRPYYKHYEIENYRNTEEGINWNYVNLPNDVIKQFAIESIKNNEPMYASCDVGAFYVKGSGVLSTENYDYGAVYGVKFGMDKKQRILTGESGSSHGMALIAVDVNDQGKPTKWQFENSWGPDSDYHGYLTFTDNWFNQYMFRFVINKKYLDSKTLKAWSEKAEMLPPWDPMF